MNYSMGLVGGRGHTGAELLGLIGRHPQLDLAFASSTTMAGRTVRAFCPAWPDPNTRFIELPADQVGTRAADAWVLAVPNGKARGWAQAIARAHPKAVIIDLSADHRFDDAWVYGLPEHHRERIRRARCIANPGCYATAGQLGLWPLRHELSGVPVIFGVSGYSGAGSAPSPRNDPERLADNLMPYTLAGHVHEREIGHMLGRDVRFMPHVANFFRGISVTISAELERGMSEATLRGRFEEFYASEPRVAVRREIPEIRQIRNTPDAMLGGFAVDKRDPRRVTMVCVLDNLAKGAASQALQNLNLALGLGEHAGL